MKRFLWIVVALLVITAPGWAHDPQLTGIRILCRKQGTIVNITTHISRLQKAEGVEVASLTPVEIDLRIRKRLRLRFDGRDYMPGKSHVIRDEANDLILYQLSDTQTVQQIEVLSRLYPEDSTSRTIVSILKDGELPREALLDAEHPDLVLARPQPTDAVSVALRYLKEGVVHIASGTDHILFIVGLLLLGGSLSVLIRTVTAFTIAHSITLSIAATGLWNPSPRIIEPLIALSICVVAIENLRTGQRSEWRPYVAFAFGLIHGFGFAGALTEVGLPKEALWVALGSFNGGVEIGQVTIVLLIAPLLALLAKKKPEWHQRVVLGGSLLIASAGSYWFISRILSPGS